MSGGKIFVISAPSGSGKTTVIKKLLKKLKTLYFSISFTTRKKRKGEMEGKDYYFISEDKFKKMIKNKELLEWANVHNNFYGTGKNEILKRIKKGQNVLLDIDIQGSIKIKKKYPESIHIFLLPPSYEELEKRLRGRGDLNEKNIKIRLKNAKKEIKKWKNYDYIVLNDNVKNAVDLISSIIKSNGQKTKMQKEKIKGIILSFERRKNDNY